jgi:hypothetical protein
MGRRRCESHPVLLEGTFLYEPDLRAVHLEHCPLALQSDQSPAGFEYYSPGLVSRCCQSTQRAKVRLVDP